MQPWGIEDLHPQPFQRPHDRLSLLGVEVVGHAPGKECHSAAIRTIGNDRSFRGQEIPLGDT